ncbi:MAG TPA: hypothetical protein VGL19_10010 [Polyangiaceae bacterium]
MTTLRPRTAGDVVNVLFPIVLLGLVTVWGLTSLWLPFGWDQSCFGYVANTILHGGMPYRDAWDFKGPLPFYVYAALQLVFGRQMWAVRALDLVLLATAASFAVRLLRQFISPRAALTTALMIALAFANFGNWYTAQPDGWAALALIIVAALLLDPAGISRRSAVVVGLLLAAATLVKPLYATYLLLVPCAAWPSNAEERRALAKTLGVTLGSFALPLLLTIGWFAAHGILFDFYDVHVRFNFERLATDPHLKMSVLRASVITFGILTAVPLIATTLPAAAAGAGVLLGERRNAAFTLLLWAALSLGQIAAQRKFLSQNYSWHALYPPLGMLAGIGLGKLWAATRSRLDPMRWLIVVVVLLLFKQVSHEPAGQIATWLRYASGRSDLAQYQSRFEVDVPAMNGGSATDFGFSVPRDLKIAAYFQAHSAASDKVLLWSDPLVNYLSDRAAITPVTAPAALTVWGSESRRARYRTQLLTELGSDSAAKLFAVPLKDLAPGSDDTNLPTLFPELISALDAHYDVATTIGDVRIYQRR